ncbi:MAG TPA: GYF domain-containing protein [Opitutales bacterium]|nr:GYF domain-containing protein [Opitutales bacterium]
MPEYYIRTPEQDESRGPFNDSKLRTLAEAGQVTENTLYYDEEKEEWIPIALNEALKAQVFPKAESLKLRLGHDDTDSEKYPDDETGINVENMLKAAEADTDETRHLKRSQKSFERAVALASMTLGLMMILSAISFVIPHLDAIQGAVNEDAYTDLLNYPFLLVGIFDLVMAVLLLLSVTEIYPLLRGRAMLGLGFGVYVGWALGDPLLMLAFGLGGAGVFLATIAQGLSTMLLAIVIGIGGNAALAYLAINNRFAEFYSSIKFVLFAQ